MPACHSRRNGGPAHRHRERITADMCGRPVPPARAPPMLPRPIGGSGIDRTAADCGGHGTTAAVGIVARRAERTVSPAELLGVCRWARNDALPSVMIDTTNQQTNPGDRYDEGEDKCHSEEGLTTRPRATTPRVTWRGRVASTMDPTTTPKVNVARSGRLDDASEGDDTEGHLAKSGRLDDGSDDDTEGNAARGKA